ncbi:436_t:CDS:10 [Dentiscutata erythropus]|uniref:436_t:CDS:1 n=1 Tax=Dentiscutata erythropus TaxID=1348616 RepID=A0A9N9FA16_9GLOM|nr:436_t:CDS:10 [Dentiscutata erythropus]
MEASPEFSERLEEYLISKEIKSFNYSQFKNVKRIGEGGYAVAYSAIFEGQIYALKSLKTDLKFEEEEFKQFKREAVLFTKTSKAGAKGLPAYVEPQCYINYEEEIEINEQSDIYSLGVLFWELTSGIPPFNNLKKDDIPFKIALNEREKIIDNTPLDYSNLYVKCWSAEPDQRPPLDQVLVELNKLSTEITIEFIINQVNSLTTVDMGKGDLTEIQIRINFSEYLNDDCFQVFGHVIDDDNQNLEGGVVRFDLFNCDGFSAFIILNQETAENVKRLHVAWLIVGKPEILGAFSSQHLKTNIVLHKVHVPVYSKTDLVYISLPYIMSENDIVLLVSSYDPPLNNLPTPKIKIIKWAECVLHLKMTGINLNEEFLKLPQLSLYVIINVAVKIDCNESFSEWFQLDMPLNEIREYIAEKKNLDPEKLQFKKNKNGTPIDHKDEDKLSGILCENHTIYITTDKSKIAINVQIDDRMETHFLGMNENLTSIRKHFVKEKIYINFIFKMMVNKVDNEKEEFIDINHRDESEKTLAEVHKNKILYISATTIAVIIYIIDKADEKNNDYLRFKYELPKEATLENIRTTLEKNSNEAQKMKLNYYFLDKEGLRIARESESNGKLLEILDITDDKAILKIIKTSSPDWTQLIEESTSGFIFKDYSIEKATKEAFIIHNKEKVVCDSRFKVYEEEVEYSHKLNSSCKSNLVFDGNISAILPWLSFSSGISLKTLDQRLKTESNSEKYSRKKVQMAEIKISKDDIHPTSEFENDVKEALMGRNKVKKLRDVTKKYGLFYAHHVVFGGMVVKSSEIKKTNNINAQTNNINLTNSINYESEIENRSLDINSDAINQVIGGNIAEYYYQDGLNKWMESLKDHQLWDIIGYDDIHFIFDLLSDDLQKKIKEALGQRILKKNVEPFSFILDESRKPAIYKLYKKLEDIPNIFECQIFTSIMNEKDKDIFSSRVDYENEDSPIILIHHIVSNEKRRKQKKSNKYEILISWVVIGYPSNFDFNQIEIDSGKYDIKINKNNQYIVEVPLINANIPETCYLGTCVLESQNDILYDPKSTIAVSVHFSQAKNSACLFIRDLNIKKSNLVTDKNFLIRLKLFFCTIAKCGNTHNIELYNISWKNDKSQPLISYGTENQKCLSNAIKLTRQQKTSFLTSIIFETCPSECKYHGLVNITSDKVMYGSLNGVPLGKNFRSIMYFGVL